MQLVRVCILTVIGMGVAFAIGPHSVRQRVKWLSGYNENGIRFQYWDLHNSVDINDYLDEQSVGSYIWYLEGLNEVRWAVEVANFPSGDDWLTGDTNVVLGSFDPVYQLDSAGYGGNAEHTGYYFIFSDTLNELSSIQDWEPKDTLREMPRPYIDYLWYTDSVTILIPNPSETRRIDQTEYDVLGYWIILDTTRAGTPDAYEASGVTIGFVPVQGGPGDTTCFRYKLRDYYGGVLSYMILYHAYHIVARPGFDVGPGECPGHKTHYMSVNFYLEWLDIAEYNGSKASFSFALFAPTIMGRRMTITYSLAKTTQAVVSLYNGLGQQVVTLVNNVKPPGAHTIGLDTNALASGVYFLKFEAGDYKETKKLILLR